MAHLLYNDDCMKVMQEIEDSSIDLVLTDPPYGMNFQSNYAKGGPIHKKIANDDKMFTEWLVEAHRILSNEHGALVAFCDWKTSPRWFDAIEASGSRSNPK